MFARIEAGAVAELFTPPSGCTIADCFHSALTWVDVSAVSPAPQVGWSATESGGVWSFAAAAAPPAPTLLQQAQAALATGVQVVSTSTPGLDGTYACDPAAQQKIQAISLFCVVNGKFPGGVTSYPWLDLAGASHSFPSVAAFQAFASAIADYVAVIDVVLATGTGTLPSLPVTLP